MTTAEKDGSALLDSTRLTFDVADIVKATGLSKPTIYGAIARGHLKSIRWGRRILIPRSALLILLNGEAE